MIILIVDDSDYRHESAEKHLSNGHTLLHAYTVLEALEIIQGCQAKIGLALLDHDLQDYVKGVEQTGSTLASLWLGLEEKKYPARVIVISSNHEGAKNIVSKFDAMGVNTQYRPYDGTLMKVLAEELKPQ